ncbi:MAG: GAF domain-containing protein [Nitrososphaeraceae archaeon]|nr:GAF domain-containing protein [Nitrososphaeraceae archaeon]
MLDEIDKVILHELGKNARISAYQIAQILHEMDYKITDRAIRQRLKRLENRNVILGYCAIINPQFVSEKVNRTILLKFKYTSLSTNLINGLINYSKDSPFCVFSARGSGDYDWIFHFVFDTLEQYELESSNFLQRFAEIIMDYRSYETKTFKLLPYSFFNDTQLSQRKVLVYKILESVEKSQILQEKLQLIVDGLVNFFDAEFARIWLLDKNGKHLILKFSAGKYKNTTGEFSIISLDSLKIGYVAKTGKPIITNDVLHDPRIKYPAWAKKEKLESFAGYPLKHKGKIIGVLAMFSKKKLNIGDFELLGVFSEKVSIELSTHFEAQEYLQIK